MNNGLMEFLVVFLGASGGLVSLVALFIASAKDKRAFNKADVDDRIAAWQKIADKREEEAAQMKADAGRMKEELKAALGRIAELEAYIKELTAAVKAACPYASIPPMPGKGSGAKA